MQPSQAKATVFSLTKKGSKKLEAFVNKRGLAIVRVDDYTFTYQGQAGVYETLLDLKYEFPVAYDNGWAEVISSNKT